MKSGEQKKVLLLVAIVVFTLGSFIVYKFFPSKDEYSDDPRDWIISNGNIKEVDIEEATKGTSYLDYIGQQINQPQIRTAFGHDGIYKGVYFKDEYVDDDENVLIRFTSELNPNNNVIEGFIIERIIDDNPVAFIFVDKDWKQQMKKTNIFWGADYENYKEFDFEEISNGIYYTKINDDKSRFSNNYMESKGGIIVGDISESEVLAEEVDDAIIIRLY